MRGLFSPLATFKLLCLPAALALLGALGCKGSSGGSTLYVYDNTSSSVLVWDDINTVYTAAQASTPAAAADRTITSSLISGMDLAWGGLAVDTTSNRLYLVTETGVVWVITQASTQNGAITSTTYITSFNLGLAGQDQFTGGSVFGQASVDGGSNTLYVTETATDGSATRIWKISNASTVASNYGPSHTFTPPATYTIGTGTDTFGCGVAAVPGGNAFGLMGGGGLLYNGLTTSYNGARLRVTQSGTFNASPYITNGGVLIGSATELGAPLAYGGLGYDSQNSALYVFAPTSSSPTDAEILVFNNSVFSIGLDQPPTRTLGDTAGALATLRTISHPANSDWLLGATFTPDTTSAIGAGTGEGTLLLWKAPSKGGAAVSATMTGTSEIRGMNVGGTN